MRSALESETDLAAKSRLRLLSAALGVRSVGQAQGRSRPGWIVADGCRIAWEQTPAADRLSQAVVCLHDAGGGSREFRPLMDRRPPGTRMVAFDWPGHGRSENPSGGSSSHLSVESSAATLLHLLQQLGIEKPILLGCGFGAAAAIRFAADHPSRVLGLILCQPAGLVPAQSAGPFAQSGKRGIARLLRRIREFAPAHGEDASAYQAARRQVLRLAAARPAVQALRTAASAALARSIPGLRSSLESLSCPALFALSRNDREYPLRRYLAVLDPSLSFAPQHQFTVFAGAFHPLWDEPERFRQAATSFIQARLPVAQHTHAWMLTAADYPTADTNLWKCVHPACAEERILAAGKNPNAGLGGR